MGNVLEFKINKEPLKLCIMNYEVGQIDIVHISKAYYNDYKKILMTDLEKQKGRDIDENEFYSRLYDYLFNQKVSEILIILYLEDIKGNDLTLWGLNKLLHRTTNQHSATQKNIRKLEALDIVWTKPKPSSSRNEKWVFINKKIVKLYGDDEFKQMMIDEWNTDAKEYVKLRIEKLREKKARFEKRIEMAKKGKRVKKNGNLER